MLPCREYALSICLASAVAKHTFRDKAATRGPQISPQRMRPRRDDDDGSSSRVTSRAWKSVAPTATTRADIRYNTCQTTTNRPTNNIMDHSIAVRSKYCIALSSSRARMRALQKMLAARRAKSAQHVGSGAVGCFARVGSSSTPSALTSAAGTKRTAGCEYELSVCLASSVAKHSFRDPAAVRGPQISPRRRTSEPYLMSARDAATAPAAWTSSTSHDLDACALSVCLASAVAKHTFRDPTAVEGPQISPQRMHPRRDDDEGRSSRVTRRAWMSRRAGQRGIFRRRALGEWHRRRCATTTRCKKPAAASTSSRCAWRAPSRSNRSATTTAGRRSLRPSAREPPRRGVVEQPRQSCCCSPQASATAATCRVPWAAPLPSRDPLLQESIAIFEFRQCGGEQSARVAISRSDVGDGRWAMRGGW